MSIRDGNAILQGLCDPGRRLIFVDDSGTSGKPLLGLARDYAILCGVILPSEAYTKALHSIARHRQTLPPDISEFHTKEIVNPSKTSSWKRVPTETRMLALRFLLETVSTYVETIIHCSIAGEQFDGEIAHRLPSELSKITHKQALERVFFRSLAEQYLLQGSMKNAIVIDSSIALHDEIRISGWWKPNELYEGGPITADSASVPGVQLADFVAYVLNRVHHVRQRAIDERANLGDEFFVEAAEELAPKARHLLQHQSDRGADAGVA